MKRNILHRKRENMIRPHITTIYITHLNKIVERTQSQFPCLWRLLLKLKETRAAARPITVTRLSLLTAPEISSNLSMPSSSIAMVSLSLSLSPFSLSPITCGEFVLIITHAGFSLSGFRSHLEGRQAHRWGSSGSPIPAIHGNFPNPDYYSKNWVLVKMPSFP